MTVDDLARKKEKEKVKKKRQKEKKKKENEEGEAARGAAEQLEKERVAQVLSLENAKRVRAGLGTKVDGACDFCGTVVRRSKDMFRRLEWAYCKTECVQKHQREMAANAAMKRMGGI